MFKNIFSIDGELNRKQFIFSWLLVCFITYFSLFIPFSIFIAPFFNVTAFYNLGNKRLRFLKYSDIYKKIFTIFFILNLVYMIFFIYTLFNRVEEASVFSFIFIALSMLCGLSNIVFFIIFVFFKPKDINKYSPLSINI